MSIWLLFAPIPAVLLGILIAHQYDIPAQVFVPNGVGLLLGILLALVLKFERKRIRDTDPGLICGFSILLVAVTLLFPGTEGVRRWVMLGPLRLNVGMIAAPFILFSIEQALSQRKGTALHLGLGAMVMHVLQPDAGQATALGMGILVLLFSDKEDVRHKLIYGVVTVICVICSWLRADSLTAVPQVERIIHLGAVLGVYFQMGLVVSIALIIIPFLRRSRLSLAFLGYLVASFAVTELGFFPVPIIGAGVSSILGWFALLGLIEMQPN